MYETALRWMREQCDKHDMFLSVAMNHAYGDAAVERNKVALKTHERLAAA
jgi:hypothetical protein